MLTRSLAYFAAQQDPAAVPLAVIVLQSNRGVRVWSDRMLTDAETWSPSGGSLADGSILADGTLQAGAQIMPILERSAGLLDPGAPGEEILSPDGLDRLGTALSGRQVSDLSLRISNADRGPSRSLAIESWLSATLSQAYGFSGLPRQDWIERFRGVVTRVEITKDCVSVTARAS